MNILPNAGVVGAAGTALAQTRSSDTETSQAQQSSLQRKESPGQPEGADTLTLHESEPAGDRDGDGRMPQSSDHPKHEPESDSPENPSASSHAVRIATEGVGERLDLDA